MSSLEPEAPPPGSLIELMRAGERQQFATAMVRTTTGELLELEGCRHPVEASRLTLRWWDDEDAAWDAPVSVEHADAPGGALTVQLLERWRPAIMRRAVRVVLDRAPVELLTVGGDGRIVRRVQVTCLDLSTTGCRVAGSGARPGDREVLQVAATSGGLNIVVDARIVHIATAAFGGWHAGIEFLPHTPAERATLLAWRDSVTHRA